jgi:hypothetical protein
MVESRIMLPEKPFGEDVTNPHSRTMPPELHGTWLTEWNDMTVITSDRIVKYGNVECVVAVRFCDAENIVLNSGLVVSSPQVAVVTLPADETKEQQYSLFYFGLSEDGDSLVDLESMDLVLYRSELPPEDYISD